MDFQAFHLPEPHAGAEAGVVLERDDARAFAPALTPAAVGDVCVRLLAARERLAGIALHRIIDAIAAAAAALRDRDDPEYDPMIRGIAAFTGYHPAMADLVVQRMADDWTAAALQRLIQVEFGGTDPLDDFSRRPDGTLLRAVPPPLSLHIFAGNVPGVAVTSMIRALLVRSAVLGKTAAGEPILAPRFARLLAGADPDIGACLAVTYWPGGDEAIEAAALARADAAVHYGGADAISSTRSRAPAHVRVIDHGPRFSCAIIHAAGVAAGDETERAASDLALATALFDQQGCVSPQLAWVIGNHDAARRIADRTAAALRRIQADLPRGTITAAEAAAIRQLRTSAEFRAIAGRPVHLWTGDHLDWTVILDPEPDSIGSCLNRSIIIVPAADHDDVIARLRPLRHLLQSVGLAGFDTHARHRLARRLADTGATRICAIRDLPWPDVAWRHDGRGPLRELVRWAEVSP